MALPFADFLGFNKIPFMSQHVSVVSWFAHVSACGHLTTMFGVGITDGSYRSMSR